MERVIIESPFSGNGDKDLEKRNIEYARMCLLDSLKRGEAPIASHLLHTQVLNDNLTDERELGIKAGLAWVEVADKSVFYIDHGYSDGMKAAEQIAFDAGKIIEFRRILENGEKGYYVDDRYPNWLGYSEDGISVKYIVLTTGTISTYSLKSEIIVNERLATQKEIEERLWMGANSLGLFEDTKIEEPISGVHCNDRGFIVDYCADEDRLWNKNGCIYNKGKWAKPLKEETLEEKVARLEKEIEILKNI